MKTKHHAPDKTDCPYAAEAVACALHPENRPAAAAAAHIASCPSCRREADAARATAARLRAMPQAEPSDGLTRRILDALPAERRRRFTLLRPLAAAAAAAAVILAGGLWLVNVQAPAGAPPDIGRWLTDAQQPDGMWRSAEAALAETNPYATALTALAALALERRGKEHRPVVDRAVTALLAGQRPDGAFGPPGRSRAYNHGMATAALLAIRQLRPQAVPDTALQSAIARIRATQDAAGAWGYTAEDAPNTALTVWQTDALIRARALGWGDPGGHLRKAVRWLKSQQTGAGRFAYDRTPGSATATLDAMGYAILLEASLSADEHLALAHQATQALHADAAADPTADFYRDYFIARALDAAGDRTHAAALRSRIANLQAANGAWDTNDRWTPVGGELYATALALLTVE